MRLDLIFWGSDDFMKQNVYLLRLMQFKGLYVKMLVGCILFF
jgi:hypothetical protein